MGALDYIVELIAFAAVLYVLYKYVWRGGLNLSGAMAKRQEEIAAEIEESRANRERLVATEAKYRESIAGARAESARIQAESAAEGEAIVAELKVKAEEEYQRMTALNESRLAAERQSVVSALRQEVGRHTVDTAEQLVTAAVRDPATSRRVIDRFIADLDVRDAQSADRGAPTPAGRAG
jgi:F-type H+-transporting ATPase subunit b